MPEHEKVSEFQTAEESPGFSLWQVSSLWQRRINAGLRPFDLTHAQFVLLASLAWLAQAPGPITQVELAQHAKIDIMMASNVLRTLEEKGLLIREQHPTDTRAKNVRITSQGAELASRTLKVVENIDRDFFSGLGRATADFNRQLQELIRANHKGN